MSETDAITHRPDMHVAEAIPVKVVESTIEHAEIEASALASWQTYIVNAGTQPFRLLAQDKRRSRAVIMCSAGNQIVLCKAEQVSVAQQQGATTQAGFSLFPVSSIEYKGASAVWAVCSASGGSTTISVLEERNLPT